MAFSIFEQMQHGLGMFSPLALGSQKRLARIAAPAVARAYGQVGAAQAGAAGRVAGQRVASIGDIRRQQVATRGDITRQNIIAESNKILEQMRQAGATTRTAMGIRGQRDVAGIRGEYGIEATKTAAQAQEEFQRQLDTQTRGITGLSAGQLESYLTDYFGGAPEPPAPAPTLTDVRMTPEELEELQRRQRRVNQYFEYDASFGS